MESIILGKSAFITRMNPLTNKNVKYVKRFKLLIRGEKAPNESIFDNKKKSFPALKFAYVNLYFSMVLRDRLLS